MAQKELVFMEQMRGKSKSESCLTGSRPAPATTTAQLPVHSAIASILCEFVRIYPLASLALKERLLIVKEIMKLYSGESSC